MGVSIVTDPAPRQWRYDLRDSHVGICVVNPYDMYLLSAQDELARKDGKKLLIVIRARYIEIALRQPFCTNAP